MQYELVFPGLYCDHSVPISPVLWDTEQETKGSLARPSEDDLVVQVSSRQGKRGRSAARPVSTASRANSPVLSRLDSTRSPKRETGARGVVPALKVPCRRPLAKLR